MARLVILVVCLLVESTLAPPPNKQYRTDYVYNQNTESFYKLHTSLAQQSVAMSMCADEGAQLVDPRSSEGLIQVHGMMKKFPDVKRVWLAGVGGPQFKNEESSEEEHAVINLTPSQMNTGISDETPVLETECEVLSAAGHIDAVPCFRAHPFVCNVAAKDAPYDSQCRVYSNNYNYSSTLGSCYKVSKHAATWNEAYSQCNAEGAHLIVLSSAAESGYIRKVLKNTPRIPNTKAFEYYFFFAGIRANKPTDGSQRVFRTIFNTTLEEAGFTEWSPGEPNNIDNSEYCGCLLAGKYNDISCTTHLGYVCEVECRKRTNIDVTNLNRMALENYESVKKSPMPDVMMMMTDEYRGTYKEN